MTRRTTPREAAMLAVAKAEAALTEARGVLRSVARAEVEALPALADATTIEAAVEVVEGLLGSAIGITDPAGCRWAEWTVGDGALRMKDASSWLYVVAEQRNVLSSVCWVYSGHGGKRSHVDMSLDAAVKAALRWLADRDAFLASRAGV